ncbi:hypothetical protein [Puniceicoccus vermicola]|uniref:Uncharacterized protein n=1 Tax=Puniceicoccus vermicola TaxID=388746 RepID=A0A7X1AW64_9BACT|nr:hypothetical protein [Puniceicoccus vermicola]MBC2600193.1 hypothetical protein [Puniceicoccus vermicola]
MAMILKPLEGRLRASPKGALKTGKKQVILLHTKSLQIPTPRADLSLLSGNTKSMNPA